MNLQLATAITFLAQGQISKAQATLKGLEHLVNDTYTDVREEIFKLRAKHKRSFLATLRQHLEKYRRYYHLEIELTIG